MHPDMQDDGPTIPVLVYCDCKVGGAGPWLVALLPIYVFVFQMGATANITWMLIAFYGMASTCIYFLRFRKERWREVIVT